MAGRNAVFAPGAAAESSPAPPQGASARLGAPWVEERIGQFIHYAWKVYDLPELIRGISDARTKPVVPTDLVLAGLHFAALLRLPSLNAMEGYLKEVCFQRLLGCEATADTKLFSADTTARVLDGLDHSAQRSALYQVNSKAERNKVFREGSVAGRRCVAIDGTELFRSRHRHCAACQTRTVRDGDEEVIEYYHRVVVALLLGDSVEVVLDIEPVLGLEARRAAGQSEVETDEGEKTAARRLIRRLHDQYGTFIDIIVLDGLYPDGPTMTLLAKLDYGAVITLRKRTDEPLKEARCLMQDRKPDCNWRDEYRREQIEAWDIAELRTLETYDGPTRVVEAHVHDERSGKTRTWCAAVIGRQTRALGTKAIHRIQRARWHEENTAFHQWSVYWNLGHVFRHTPGAICSMLLILALTFNLLQLFVYRRLRRSESLPSSRRPSTSTSISFRTLFWISAKCRVPMEIWCYFGRH